MSDQQLLQQMHEVEGVVFSVLQKKTGGDGGKFNVADLAPALNQKDLTSVCDSTDDGETFNVVKDWHNALGRRTYSVASFWSPIDKTRRSVYHSRLHSSHPDRLSWAYLFFLLTHRGRSASTPLYSATQYLAEQATRKYSPPIWFGPQSSAPLSEDLWVVPPNVRDELLNEYNITKYIEQICQRSQDDLVAGLKNVLTPDLRSLPADDLLMADEILARIYKSQILTTDYIAALAPRLEQWFYASGDSTPPDIPLDSRQILFMTLTYIIWWMANPETLVAYTFPSHVENTVCVLTIGSEEMASVFQQSLLAWFSKTLFLHPLIHDYQIVARNRLVTSYGAQMLGHNLINHLLLPSAAQIRKMQASLLPPGEGQPLASEAVYNALENIRLTIRHYDSLARSQSTRVDTDFAMQNLSTFRIGEAFEELDHLFHACLKYQYYHDSDPERNRLRLKFEGDGCQALCCDRAWLVENLANLVTNSLRYGDLNLESPNFITIRATVLNTDQERFLPCILIAVEDGGCGCDSLTMRLNARIGQVLNASNADLPAIREKLALEQVTGGVGVSSCALHVRCSWGRPCPETMVVRSLTPGLSVLMAFPLATLSSAVRE